MTEYWVSQGKKWCDFCKIYIANNPLSIRTHELGKRHKDNVANRLATIQKEGAAKEKEQKAAARALEQIEAKAKRSYQNDLASFQEAENSSADDIKSPAALGDEWVFDAASGYYYNKASGFHYDANSGLYYSNDLGKWVAQEEAFKSVKVSKPDLGQTSMASQATSTGDGAGSKCKGGAAPGLVVSTSLNLMRTIKGAKPSSIAVNKRKRDDNKSKEISKEEAAALKAREAARKRVEEREKPLMGLHRSY